MPWIDVKNFDEDVKVGDKLCYSLNDLSGGIICVEAITLKSFVGAPNSSTEERLYPKSSITDLGHWQVWRVPKRWKAEKGQSYWMACIGTGGSDVIGVTNGHHPGDRRNYESGNYFRTQEQAQEYADECKKLAEKLHERYGE